MGAFSLEKHNSITILLISALLMGTVLLSGCEFIDNAMRMASNKTQENTDMIDDYLRGEDVDIKFDTPSASDVINGEYGTYEEGGTTDKPYYDEKSGQYVSRTQFKANNLVDNLKTFWIPVCVITFFIGFMIRRLNHSSATLRKIGFFFEIIFPVLLTVLVYVACALADSSMIDFFDNLF